MISFGAIAFGDKLPVTEILVTIPVAAVVPIPVIPPVDPIPNALVDIPNKSYSL